MLSLKCKLLISLPELQNVAAFPFSYISLMLSTLTQVSELPSVPTLLPETSSSLLSPQWSCPLKIRFVVDCSIGTVLSSCFVLALLLGAAAEFPICSSNFTRGRNSLGRHELSLPTVHKQHQQQGDYTQRRSAEFLQFFPFISSISTLEFLQPLSQICHSFNFFLEAKVSTTPVYKCLLWITLQVLTRHEHKHLFAYSKDLADGFQKSKNYFLQKILKRWAGKNQSLGLLPSIIGTSPHLHCLWGCPYNTPA